MTTKAQKIYDAWEDEYCRQKPFYEHRALASAIRKIIDEFEYHIEGDDGGFGCMVVSSQDLYNLAVELENLKDT